MTTFPSLEPWWRFGAALLIGALVGLEREFVQQRSGDPDFAGIRTFTLLALLGAIAAYLAEIYGILLFVAAYLGLVLLIWVSLFGGIHRGEEEGITTEVVGLLVPFLGAMVIWGFPEIAAALGVITSLILALKNTLHGLARRMSLGDLRAILEFAIITAVVLPLLPNESYGPFGVLNPYEIWLLVVLVSGISFVGYILIKTLGARRGVGLTGLLGGLVSSTAVTLSFAGRSKEDQQLSPLFAIAIILASSVMFPRVMIEVAIVYLPLLRQVGLPLLAMMVTGMVSVVVLWRRQIVDPSVESREVSLKNPLNIWSAIAFGIGFALVLVVVRASNEFFGDVGVYLASVLAGLVDVDAITLSASDLAAKGQVTNQLASTAILIGALVNTTVKGITAYVLGSQQLRRIVLRVFPAVLLVGILSTVLTFSLAA